MTAPARRIALFSDVHGNAVALDAVFADIEHTGIEEIYCLGDLVGYGPDPAGVIERVRSRGIPTVRGNYDEGVGSRRGDCGCYYATDQAAADGQASYAFTDAVLDDADHEWLVSLPDEIRFEHEGTRVLLCHGSPRKINEYLLPDRSDEQLLRLAQAAAVDVVCVGHVHIPYHRMMAAADGHRVDYISTGSVGKPKDGDPRACWVEFVLGEGSVTSHAHRVEYDVTRVVAAVRAAGLPESLGTALLNG